VVTSGRANASFVQNLLQEAEGFPDSVAQKKKCVHEGDCAGKKAEFFDPKENNLHGDSEVEGKGSPFVPQRTKKRTVNTFPG